LPDLIRLAERNFAAGKRRRCRNPLYISTGDGATVEHDYERVFRETGPHLWRALYAFTGGRRQIAEEAMAEAFARAMEHHGIRDPASWIYRTAFRIARLELDRERRPPPPTDDVDEPPNDLRDLVEALRRLPPNQRAAVVLRYEADLPVDDIARRMGLSPSTVRVHLHRARTRLRELLKPEDAEHV
jgi:RNA polymerase sigma-70 factor, ECF subfamily